MVLSYRQVYTDVTEVKAAGLLSHILYFVWADPRDKMFFISFVIKLKILFQFLCSDRIDWDEPLQGNMLECWTSLAVGLKALDNIRVPQCYFHSESSNDVQLIDLVMLLNKPFCCSILAMNLSWWKYSHYACGFQNKSDSSKQTINSLLGIAGCLNSCKIHQHSA